MNSEIGNRLLQMFIKLDEIIGSERGSLSNIEMTKDETNMKNIYTQTFIFGKDNKEYKFKGYLITDLNNEIFEEKYEELGD